MDRDQDKILMELGDRITSNFSEFMLRIAKIEELVDVTGRFLICFRQELETFRRPQLYKTSKVVDQIIEANQTDRMKTYIEAGSRHRCDDVQNMTKLCSCGQGLQEHPIKVKILLAELEVLTEDAIDIAKRVHESTMQFLDACAGDEEGLNLDEEALPDSMMLQDKFISQATLMEVIRNMIRLDYAMQETIINSIDYGTKSEQLESYCLMWNLRPYINDNIMQQAWKFVS